jgi:putative phosphoesterase
MRIGIISDIHAHLHPLEKALRLFEREGVDQIICAGDLIDGGNDGDVVVELIQQQKIPTVQGNHDRDAFSSQAWLRKVLTEAERAATHILLKSQTVGYVSGLPLTLHFEWEGKRVCLAHGTPWSNFTYVFPDCQPDILRQVARAAQANIVILGHTHLPMRLRYKNVWIVNPGSVSCNRYDESRTCAILALPEMTFEVWNIDTETPTDIL